MKTVFVSKHKVEILTWIRICYLQNFDKNKIQFWLNDFYEEKLNVSLSKIEGGGSFYLGQDQDDMDSGFSLDQSLNAIIANFIFFDSEISVKEAERFVSCKSKFTKTSFMNFQETNSWKLNDSVAFGEILEEEICKQMTPFYLMFPEERSFIGTVNMCSNFNATIPVPKNVRENSDLISIVEDYKDICNDGSGNTVWLAVSINLEQFTFVDYYDKTEIIYKNYNNNVFVEGSECTSMLSITLLLGKWFGTSCNAEPLCGICKFEDVTEVRVSNSYQFHFHFFIINLFIFPYSFLSCM